MNWDLGEMGSWAERHPRDHRGSGPALRSHMNQTPGSCKSCPSESPRKLKIPQDLFLQSIPRYFPTVISPEISKTPKGRYSFSGRTLRGQRGGGCTPTFLPMVMVAVEPWEFPELWNERRGRKMLGFLGRAPRYLHRPFRCPTGLFLHERVHPYTKGSSFGATRFGYMHREGAPLGKACGSHLPEAIPERHGQNTPPAHTPALPPASPLHPGHSWRPH